MMTRLSSQWVSINLYKWVQLERHETHATVNEENSKLVHSLDDIAKIPRAVLCVVFLFHFILS